MKAKSVLRLEWISLVYLAIFVLAVLSPSLVTSSMWGIPEHRLEEGMIFFFGIIGLTTFSIYQRILERSEKAREDVSNEYERAKRELVESYQYIGSINRQIEVLKRVANQTSLKIVGNNHLSKDLLMSLLTSAASSVGARMAAIRYVDLEKARTQHELLHSLDGRKSFKISNRELCRLHEEGTSHATVRNEDGQEILIIPSDHHSRTIKAYLLIIPDNARELIDTSLLKVFANQAELLHYTLEQQPKLLAGPLEMVKEAERKSLGEVS